MKFETTENTTTLSVISALLRKNRQNGITVVASRKLLQWNSCGNRQVGTIACSSGPLRAEMIIQYRGRENRSRTSTLTNRKSHALIPVLRERSGLRPSYVRAFRGRDGSAVRPGEFICVIAMMSLPLSPRPRRG